MSLTISSTKTVPQDLGDGLVLRTALPADTEALVEFNQTIHGNDSTGEPDLRVGAWVRDLMVSPPPAFSPDLFTIVEDTATGKIVSSLNLIPQTWAFDGISFSVGRPEVVGTLPEYRNRGLVRRQFDLIHQWSAARGDLLQGITGIPYYYRIFGYEMAVTLGGGRVGFRPHVPALPADTAEPYRIRPASNEDIPFLQEVYTQGVRRGPLASVWDDSLWSYELHGKSPTNVNRRELRIIENTAGERLGFFAHSVFNWGPTLVCFGFELKPGVSWSNVTPTVIRYLMATAEQYQARDGGPNAEAFGFWLGEDHPVFHAVPDSLPRKRNPYAWYIRIPDLPAFLRTIAPALEARLTRSPLAGHTGELKLSFYRDGLRLALENGHFTAIEPWKPAPFGHSGNAAFPGLTFTQLLLSYRSLDELQYAFVDCTTSGDEPRALLNALFPRCPSDIWPIS